MYQEHFQGSPWLWLPLISLVFFFVFFMAVLVRVIFGMRDRQRVNELASLPFTADRNSSTYVESSDG